MEETAIKSLFEEVGGAYHEGNGFLISNLALPSEEEKPSGIWGQRHLRYLKKCRRVVYFNLLTSGRLDAYLADIDEQAEDMFLRLVKQMAECEGVTEQPKVANQMSWIRSMNNIRS